MSAQPPDHRLEETLARFGRLLESAVRRVCPAHLGIDTQDVVQEARLRLWRFLQRATEGELTASYVYRVAASAAIDATRAVVARREEQMQTAVSATGEADESRGIEPPADPSRSPEAYVRRRELAAIVEAALEELPLARQRAVRLHLWGLTSPEIATLTGWSPTKTRTLISRGLRELRSRLAGRGVDQHAGS